MSGRSRRALAAFAFVAGIGAKMLAQAQAPPPPPPPPIVSGPCDGRTDPTGSARIRGVVVAADTATPLRNAAVRLSAGGLCRVRSGMTNGSGEYVFGSLPAGRFTVSASKLTYITLSYGQMRPFEAGRPVELAAGQTLDDVNIALPRGGVIVAHVTDESGEPIAGVRVQAERMQFLQGRRQLVPMTKGGYLGVQTDDRGEIRLFGLPAGDYLVSATGEGSNPLPASIGSVDQTQRYLPTYFPGVASASQATRVTVRSGQDTAIAFPLVFGRLLQVRGTVRGSDGSVLRNAAANFANARPGMNYSRIVPIQADGSFAVTSVLPGEYRFAVSTRGGGPSSAPEFADVTIALTNDDVSGLAVMTHVGGALSGRFVYDTPPPSSFAAGSLKFTFDALNDGPLDSFGAPAPQMQQWRADSTFELSGLTGRGVLRMPAASGWVLKRVMADGRDLTDLPFDFSDGKQFRDVQVVVTQQVSAISGTVRDHKDQATQYTVLLFPENRQLWRAPSRFIAAARADQRGLFRIGSLPSGRYLIVAVEYAEEGSEYDTDLLSQLTDRAVRIDLAEGESKELTLNLLEH
jgi:hypothetical protein